MSDVYGQLLDVRDRVEEHFRDMCEIEFTIENGRLFILSVRPGRRTPRANLVILLQLLSEGKIELRDFMRRVRLADVEDFCAPDIRNLSSLRYLGRGMPACGGAATGEIVFDSTVALRLARQDRSFVFVREEMNPEDVEAMCAAQGVITRRGGMTSHAAVVCRGLRKPCVVGFSEMEISGRPKSMSVHGHGRFDQGEWITLDGSNGRVYAGEGDVSVLRWQDIPELRLLAQLTDLAIKGEDVPTEAVGQTWKLWDLFAHNIPLRRVVTSKRAIRQRHAHVSFVQPPTTSLDAIRHGLAPISGEEKDNYSTILVSMADTLSRLLSASLGIGNHHLYFRPLWDPKVTVDSIAEDQGSQMVGFEFFGINRQIPHLLDIATLSFILDIELLGERGEWFLDHTNPNGEGLVTGSTAVKSYCLRLNDGLVCHEDIPVLYNTLRRREYEWQFYQSNDTTHAAVIQFLESWSKGCPGDERLIALCFERGLLRGHGLTLAGESLVGRCDRRHRHEQD